MTGRRRSGEPGADEDFGRALVDVGGAGGVALGIDDLKRLALKRGRHDVRGCSVKLSAERAATDPKVFTRIHMHFTVRGRGLPAPAVERAIAMSHEKYCSASAMLAHTAEMTTSFDLVEDPA